MDQAKINHCVEIICNKGCVQVRQEIERLQSGEITREIKKLEKEERLEVLRELVSIMAVYGDSCRI